MDSIISSAPALPQALRSTGVDTVKSQDGLARWKAFPSCAGREAGTPRGHVHSRGHATGPQAGLQGLGQVPSRQGLSPPAPALSPTQLPGQTRHPCCQRQLLEREAASSIITDRSPGQGGLPEEVMLQHSMVVKNMDSGARLPRLESSTCRLLAV